MTQITINEQSQPFQYLLVSRIDDADTTYTTNIVISDENNNQIKIVNIEQGPMGQTGAVGPQGPAGQDAVQFDLLPVVSGGTNNTIFNSGYIIYYDGNKLSSTSYTIQDILDQSSTNANAITGVIAGSGLLKNTYGNTVTLDTLLGAGLEIGQNNEIKIDNTIARLQDLEFGNIDGQLSIGQGGTNNNFYTQNRLVYFDGIKIKSFPIATGNFLFSGISVDIIAGSGLVGGGNLSIPNGSVLINIPSSADILVTDNSISLTPIGIAGTYSKITTDDKGRVIQGSSLTSIDILNILGYTPYHAGNDGAGSNLDADLLDGQHGSYYTDASNLTGLINTNVIPSSVEPGTYTKVAVSSNGLITDVYYADQSDIISSLGYTPVPDNGSKTIYGDTILQGDVSINGELEIYDHLPLLATDNPNILPDTPRGISFIYGGLSSTKTGILAYYPADNQLKLITNVFSSGTDIDGNGLVDDLNGGNAESIYVLQNLDGDTSVVLLKNIADNLYVKTSTDEEINGLKTFLDQIIVRKQISITNPPGNTDPPLDISDNTNKVINLNVDLLDGEHKEYYIDAANMTGAFNYENVTFDHIQGDHRYIPKFDDTVNDPANRINSSNLFQNNNGNIILDNNASFSIGTNSNISDTINSLNVGSNAITGNRSIAVGSSNKISANNSVAFGNACVVNANNAMAIGDHGIASLSKQLAMGVFNVDGTGNIVLEHGQHTTISMHLVGTEVGDSWTSLTPSVTIPNNKTIAYNAELLITRAFGTGVAHYKFESGLFKNSTFRNSNSVVDILNVTTHPQRSKKLELFNNSQFKNHYHTFQNTDGSRTLQDIKVTEGNIFSNPITAENTEKYYFFTEDQEFKYTSGHYLKTNNGDLILDIDKPIYSGHFTMDTNSKGIRIFSKNHGTKAGSLVDLMFFNTTGFPIADGKYKVYSVINEDVFFVERPYYSGYVSYASGNIVDYMNIDLSQNSIENIDKLYIQPSTSGTIDIDGDTIHLSNQSFVKNLHTNSHIVIQSGNYLFNRLVSNISGNIIVINDPIATGNETLSILSGPVKIYQIDFSYSLFQSSPRILVETETDGIQFISTNFTGIHPSFQGRKPFAIGITEIPFDTFFYSTGNYILDSYVNTNINLNIPSNTFFENNVALLLHMEDDYDEYGNVISGILTDSSANAIRVSAPFKKTTENGKFGRAMIGANTASANNQALIIGKQPFTIETWIYISQYPNKNQRINIVGESSFSSYLSINNIDDIIYLELSNDTQCISVPETRGDSLKPYARAVWTPTLNAWHHIAACRDSIGNVFLFVDGERLDTISMMPLNWSLVDFTSSTLVFNNASIFNLDEFRLTIGAARYTMDFEKPSTPFPHSEQMDYLYPSNISFPISINNLNIPKRNSFSSGIPAKIMPLIENSGSVFLYHKNSISGTFTSSRTEFNKYNGIFVRSKSNNNSTKLQIFNSKLEPINLPYKPITYALVDEYGPNDNDKFEIESINDIFFLKSKTIFNYEDKNIYSIRIKACDRSNQCLEKNLDILINDLKSPYLLNRIPDQTTSIDTIYEYTIPNNVFNVEDNEGSLIYSARLQNGNTLPSWLSFDSNTITFSGQPSGCDFGIYNIRVFASNNFTTIYDDFFLKVNNNPIQNLEYYNNNILQSNIPTLQDITLSSFYINENLPSGTIISSIDVVGSYDPYIEFRTATNSFSGIFRNNDNIVECLPIIHNLPSCTISGSSSELDLNSIVHSNILNSGHIVKNIYNPFVVNGYPLLKNDTIIIAGDYKDNTNTYYPGMTISHNLPFDRNLRIEFFDDYSLLISNVLMTENNLNAILTENLSGLGIEQRVWLTNIGANAIWATNYSGCQDINFFYDPGYPGYNSLIFTNRDRPYDITINTSRLTSVTPSPQSGLKLSNIKFGQDNWRFENNEDLARFNLDNPVLSVYGLGSGQYCKLMSENYDAIYTENNNSIISDTNTDHGTRITISQPYEIIESIDIYKNNGRLSVNNFDFIICENQDPLVHDYAIAARSGDAHLIFMGNKERKINFSYPDDIDLNDTVYNYYYNWGLLTLYNFYNDKYYIKLNEIYNQSNASGIVTYSGNLPENNNYNISGLKSYTYIIQSGSCSCPTDTNIIGYKGFDSTEHIQGAAYVTGLISFYTEAGTGVNTLTFSKDINLDNRYENILDVYDFNSQNLDLDLPIEGLYKNLTYIDANTVSIHNYFLMPNSGIVGHGTFEANIDINHGYTEDAPYFINRIPVQFISTLTKFDDVDISSRNKPKNYTFDILNIEGNKIYVKDNQNYVLKENNRSAYFEQPIDGTYLTNGIGFSGSLFNNNSNIYDIRYNFGNLTNTYNHINFQYKNNDHKFSFIIASGIIKPYDDIRVYFPTGFGYDSDSLESLIHPSMIQSRISSLDLEPDKDSILLETSTSIDASSVSELISFSGNMSTNIDTVGTCIIDNEIINRLQEGMLINHNNSNIYGYQINGFISGFNFSGYVPKNHNIISANIDNLLSNMHIGYASVFNTGSLAWYSGARLLGQVGPNQIGYNEYYFINSSGSDNFSLPKEQLSGIGGENSPYQYALSGGLGFDKFKSLDFLYLGHDNRIIRITGLAITYGVSSIEIRHYTLEKQTQILRSTGLYNIPCDVDPIFSFGSNEIVATPVDIYISGTRFDKINILVKGNDLPSNPNVFYFQTFIDTPPNIKPYYLDSSIILNSGLDFYPYINIDEPSITYIRSSVQNIDGCVIDDQYIPQIDPSYSTLIKSPFYILPIIKTNNKYCGSGYKKNEQMFYNGNIIQINNLSTLRSHLEKNDQLKIISLNDISLSSSGVATNIYKYNFTENQYEISGISIDGYKSITPKTEHNRPLILDDIARFDTPFGISHDELLNNTGLITFIKFTSGTCNILNTNNLYYHTYGGNTSHYPLDINGNYVQPPQTGIYSIVKDISNCTSGTLCVIVSGYKTPIFTGVYPGKNLYFDFSDGFNEISNSYPIEDLLGSNVISIKVPYSENYLNKSGLVYLIDSIQNIKSNLNPNINNSFIISDPGLQGINNTNIFNYFDNNSKRWKHTIHLNDQPPYTGYNLTLKDKSSRFLSINPEPIVISQISYSFNNGVSFNTLNSNNLQIPSNISQMVFRITTLNGELSLFDQQRQSIPRVSISGISNYYVEFDEPQYYGYHGSGWDIGIVCNMPQYDYTNKNIVFRASDLTGKFDKAISISKYMVPEIISAYTGYVSTGNLWKLTFDISNLDLYTKYNSNEITFILSNIPDNTNYNIVNIDNRSIVYSGNAGNITGLFYPELVVTDLTTDPYTPIATGTGTIMVLNHISSQPSFDLRINNLESTYYLNKTHQDYIYFDIPAVLGPTPSEVLDNLNITFNTNPEYRIQLYSSSYNYNTNRFEIIGIPINTGNYTYVDNVGKYTNQSITINIKQPIYDEFGNYIYQTYTKSFGFNNVIYENISFEPLVYNSGLVFKTNEPWSISFYLNSGVVQFDSQNRPNVSIFNTPNIGSYDTIPIEYTLDYEFINDEKRWKVEAVGTKDYYGRYVSDTGIYPLNIYINDGLKSYIHINDFVIRYNNFVQMKNISSNIYTTPDNEFFTKVDIFDKDFSTIDPISFPANLKESSIILGTPTRNYDRDLFIWENSYIGEKMIQKYDAQMIFNNNTMTLQCKGIGKDKIIAVAKVQTIEIESNELQGIPLTITGVKDFDNPSGIVVKQGDKGWELTFQTIGGLAHSNYPPTILLDNMPTFCSGFNPLIDSRLQCQSVPPVWDANLFGGAWTYVFSGLPSCTLLGEKTFSITAIDTDPNLLPDNPYLPDTDYVEHKFTFVEGEFSGTPPQIVASPLYENMDIIKPLCGVYYIKQLDFGPTTPALCLGPTGIKSFSVSGSVPSGLNYTVFFPSETQNNVPQSPYSNIGSGYLKIEGYPLTFANGGAYTEKLTLTVTDARDLTTSQDIVFSDSSSPNDPDVFISLYFDTYKPTLSPGTGLKNIKPGEAFGWRPAPIEDALVCNSILPHNKCNILNITYSGNIGLDTRVFLIQPDDGNTGNDIKNGDSIYLSIQDSNNDDINGSYTVFNENSNLYIDAGISLTVQNTGLAKVVLGNYTSINVSNYNTFFQGNIVNSTSKCLLGGGKIQPELGGLGLGLGGLLIPSYKASITGITSFSQNNTKYSGLYLERVNPEVDVISATAWSDCWQTGYVKLSGIVVPSIYAEIVDPPPAQDYYFSFNGVKYALSTRLAYGETEVQKLLLDNQRTNASLFYELKDILNGNTIQNGNVTAGNSFDTSILSLNSGTVYQITIHKPSDVFPTYNYAAQPSSTNEYLWIHKGDNLTTIPTQTTFPPILPIGFDSISAINNLDDADPNGIVMNPVYGLAIGGYVPTDDGIGLQIPYSHTGSPPIAWSTANYLPIISGIIQKNLLKEPIINLNALYTISNNLTKITIASNNMLVDDIISINFYNTNNALIYNTGLIISADNLINSTLVISGMNLGVSDIHGRADIEYKAIVSGTNPDTKQLIIKHPNISFNNGDHIGIDKNNYISTELELLKNNGFISIASGTNELLYLQHNNPSIDTWYNNFQSGDFVSLYLNIDDNIKIMPYNTTYRTEGQFIFQITGRSNTRENEDLIYKICTMENKNMPIFDSGNYPSNYLLPKQYFKNYPLYINKPITIIPSTIAKNGNLLSFSILGGKRPIFSNTPDIQLAAGINDFGYCGFWRNSIGTGNFIVDEYDVQNDRLNISLILSSDYGIDWSLHNSVRIKVSDETGEDTYTFNF